MSFSDERLPLYQRLRDEMVSKIANREWQPNVAIPAEIELTKTYGVAIGTVRKAVELLVTDGVLERIQGRGTFVRRPNFDTSFFRFFRHQTIGVKNKMPEGHIISRTLITPPDQVASSLKLNKRAKTIRLERLRLIDGKPVLLEEIWLPHTKFSALMDIELRAFGDLLYPFYEAECGQTIASAQEILSVDTVDAEVAKQLGITEGSPIVVIDRLAFGYDQNPLEWRRSRGLAKDFRYQIEIR